MSRFPSLHDRAEAALLGLAIGDALGMPTQSMSREQIARTYGTIRGLVDAVSDQPIAPLMPAGTITDDTEQALLLGELLIAGDGRIEPRGFADALADWERGMEAKGSRDLLGPSTKAAIAAIQGGATPEDDPGRGGTTNGAAMRITPVGIAFPPDRLLPAVADASRLTHNTGLGLSAAAAVGMAVSYALEHPDATMPDVVAVAAEAADALAGTGNWAAGGAVGPRIRWAAEAVAGLDAAAALEFVADVVGTSVASQESVPAVFALISRFGDGPYATLLHATALGGDTDTMAAMAGAVLGALHGRHAWPGEVADRVLSINDLDLRTLVDGLLGLRHAAA
ncbi:ADP-ribosylglycohydrolase family protein [Kocuria coralli]|uniref:ADP-ribosylglycohydrolase family protein n=1 Tax=Kocuria coralli TaxID=1461025 RepID=A0A5J5KYY3_9MICC|nr:ADP-ribosylglycohydrolase family protein [Kocuria coralli]KAA9394849.1 ADP-ribosylglycohydrolase family protein [Kocuria coralli]